MPASCRMCLRTIDTTTGRRGPEAEFCSERCLLEHRDDLRRMDRRVRSMELAIDRARRRMMHGWAGFDLAHIKELEATLAHLRAERALLTAPARAPLPAPLPPPAVSAVA